jgi:hypothetical protein
MEFIQVGEVKNNINSNINKQNNENRIDYLNLILGIG